MIVKAQLYDKPFPLGRYEVVGELYDGLNATVHLARTYEQGGFQRWAALKVLASHVCKDEQFAAEFHKEAHIAAAIRHPSLIQVFDVGKDGSKYWLAMEYVHGEPLTEILRNVYARGVSIPSRFAVRVCSDIAEGLHALHEMRDNTNQLLGLVHQRVTPDNIMVTYDGFGKLKNFGPAQPEQRLSARWYKRRDDRLPYISPEMVRGANLDRKMDVFSLGVILWEMTTGQRLFLMDEDIEILDKIQQCNVTPPSQIIPGYPDYLDSIVMTALARRASNRFSTAQELSRALQEFLAQSGKTVTNADIATFLLAVFKDASGEVDARLVYKNSTIYDGPPRLNPTNGQKTRVGLEETTVMSPSNTAHQTQLRPSEPQRAGVARSSDEEIAPPHTTIAPICAIEPQAITADAKHPPLEVFIAYARKDLLFRKHLHTHLVPLEHAGLIKVWHDRKILAGEDWKAIIDERLSHASLILLLVSPAFLASPYCHHIEFTRAMERHRARDAIVIPIILKKCQWRFSEDLASLQALPTNGKPVSQWADRDDGLHNVAMGIRRAIEEQLF